MRLVKPVAMVSAGIHGIGLAISRALHEDGYWVSASTAKPEPIEHNKMPDLDVHLWQPTQPDAAQQWVDEMMRAQGRIDVLVNNLGPYLWDYPAVADTSDESWDFILRSNLTLSFQLAKAAIPHMRQQGGGVIVNIGCVGASLSRGWPLRGAYAAAKSGLASLTKTIAAEEQPYGISCAMVCPSDIRGTHKEIVEGDMKNRLRSPNGGDVARVVAFLAQPESFYLSGNVIELASPVGSLPPRVGESVWVEPIGGVGTIQEIKQEAGYSLYLVQPEKGKAGWYSHFQLRALPSV